jgi:BatD DUF11 like domain
MTNARRWLLPCLVLLLCLSATLARAASPMARVHVLGEQPALVNQQVRIEVEILTPNYFTSAPPFPDIQIPGAIVTMPDETGQNSVEQIDGQTYAGILKTYVFTAQQPGDFTLPSLAVKFSYGGDDGKSRPGEVTLPPTHISVRAAEGATMAGGVQAPVARLSITQSFDRPVDGKDAHLEAGDALVRTLDTFAEMTQAMMIPPPKIEAPSDVRVFTADPKLDDVTRDRAGLVGGHRIDRVTYVFEKPGTYKLPAIDIAWFDANTNKQEKAEAPAVTIVVAARRHGEGIAPEAEAALTAGERSTDFWRHVAWRRWIFGAFVLGVLAFAASWLASRLPGWRRSWRLRQEASAASEPAHFEAVVAACRKNDPEATYAALMTWSRLHVGCGASAWGARMGEEDLVRNLGALEARLFGGAVPAGGVPWQSDPLLSAVQRVRTQWLASRKVRDAEHRALPALNPGDERA